MMEVVKYDLNKAEIAKMASVYLKLTIKDLNDKEGFDAVHAAKMTMVKHRCNIDKLRKATNADAQTFIKTNNANAKKLLDQIRPIEDHLKAEEEKITKEKERIQKEKEAAEKVKIDDRVTALFAVNVNIPYFDAAMLNDAEFETMLDEATNNHMAERLRIQEEEKAKEEEGARLKDERVAQEAEANRLADIQAAQEAKERELKEQREAIENAKRDEQERIDREAFEKQAIENARVQAEKDAEKERIEQITKVEETRLRSLQAVGFVYPAKDLGTMQDKKFFALYDKHKKVWDKKQKEILAEKIEQERIKKEKAEAAEKARVEALRPEREVVNLYAQSILDIPLPDVKDERLQAICLNAKSRLVEISDRIIEQVEEL